MNNCTFAISRCVFSLGIILIYSKHIPNTLGQLEDDLLIADFPIDHVLDCIRNPIQSAGPYFEWQWPESPFPDELRQPSEEFHHLIFICFDSGELQRSYTPSPVEDGVQPGI